MKKQPKNQLPSEDEILNQLFDNNFVEWTASVTSKHVVTFRTISVKDQLAIDLALGQTKGTQSYVLHLYAVTLLSYAIKKVNTKIYSDLEQTREYVESLPTALVDALIKKFQEFDNSVKSALNPEAVKKTFTQEADQTRESELPQKD